MPMTRTSPSRPRRRTAAVTLELILALPVLVIALLVVIEFGVLMANLKHVAAASRDGAKLAAETAPLGAGATAAALRSAIDRRLESAGFGAGAAQGVTLRHTVGSGSVVTDGICSDPTTPAMPDDAVRVTVCVELTRLAPDLLATFGFSLAGKVAEHTTTFHYER
jgi:Flp pilus assembly protein TadG